MSAPPTAAPGKAIVQDPDALIEALFLATKWRDRLGLGAVETWDDAHIVLVTAVGGTAFLRPERLRVFARGAREAAAQSSEGGLRVVHPSAMAPAGSTQSSSSSMTSSRFTRRSSSARAALRTARARARSFFSTASYSSSSSSISPMGGSVARDAGGSP